MLPEALLHSERDELPLSPAMDVPFDPAAFLILRCDQPLAGCWELFDPVVRSEGHGRPAGRWVAPQLCLLPLPFRRSYRWEQNRAGVGFVTPYTARRVAWSVGISSIALLLASRRRSSGA